MRSAALDLKIALRSLRKSPGFALVTGLTLALGIGANTAMFAVVHSVLLRPLPFPEPDRLVTLWELVPDDAGRERRMRATAGNFRDWRSQSESFEDVALFGAAGLNWTGDGEPEQLLGARVTASYFTVLGIRPVVGRTFLPEDNAPGRERVVLLGHGLWQRRFGGDPGVVGRSMTLDGAPYEVVGVLPPAVYPTWPQATGRLPFLAVYQQIWVPMALPEERLSDRRSHVFGVIARLREGATLERARSEMETIARRLEAAYPDANAGEGVLVTPYLDEVVGSARAALSILLAAVGLVLLMAGANIAGLMLARSASRQRETAMRAALGAGRRALLAPFLAESFLLGLGGGALGLVVAVLGIEALVGVSPAEVPRLAEAHLGPLVLLFAFTLSVLAALALGLAPAMGTGADGMGTALEQGARSVRTGSGSPSRRALVVVQVALAVVVVASAALLVESFDRLRRGDLGFRAEGVAVFDLALPASHYESDSAILRFQEALLERARALPGVESAALAYDHPLESNWTDAFRLPARPSEEPFGAALRIVSPDYFRSVGIAVTRGRAFTELDDAAHPGAVIVNEAFVDFYLDGRRALGERLATTTPNFVWKGAMPETFEIVGVVDNVRFLGPAAAPEPAFYLPAKQFPQWDMLVVAKTSSDPSRLAPALRQQVWSADPSLPVSNFTTLERLRDEAVAEPRFTATVLGAFGCAALGLAALGLYGLLSYGVVQRRSEIGLRMAIGARASDVVRLVLCQGLSLTATGLAAGLAAALLATRALSGLLFAVSPNDPATLAGVALLLGGVAALASYVPARRASRIDPLEALRQD